MARIGERTESRSVLFKYQHANSGTFRVIQLLEQIMNGSTSMIRLTRHYCNLLNPIYHSYPADCSCFTITCAYITIFWWLSVAERLLHTILIRGPATSYKCDLEPQHCHPQLLPGCSLHVICEWAASQVMSMSRSRSLDGASGVFRSELGSCIRRSSVETIHYSRSRIVNPSDVFAFTK